MWHTLFFPAVLKGEDSQGLLKGAVFQPRLSRQRQSQISLAPRLPVRSIVQLDRSSMRLSDLLRKDKADSGTTRLGRVKRYKQVARIGQSGSIIEYRDDDLGLAGLPRDIDVCLVSIDYIWT